MMPALESTLEDLERARRRKKDLKRQLKNLVEKLRLAKREEEMHTKRARALIQEHEYSGFTDTIKLDEPPK